MTFLPIVERELRVASRRPRIYWGRCLACTVAIGLVAWLWLTFGSSVPSNSRAEQLFIALGSLGLIYALFVGFMLTADLISEEKREGTLGLLFLTDLKGYDVVFGKLAASSVNAVYGLMAIFPVMTLPLLLGGIAYADVGRMALVLLNTLWFSLAVGLLVSSFSRHDRKAQVAAFLLMFGVTAAWPMFMSWWGEWAGVRLSPSIYSPSPVFSFVQAFDRQFVKDPGLFWLSFGIVHAMGWICLLMAGFIVPRVWQDKPAAAGSKKWKERWREWRNGSAAQRRSYREQLLKVTPFYWLSSRDRLKPVYLLLVLAVAALVWMGLWWKEGTHQMIDQGTFVLTALILHTVLKVWLCSEATRLFAEDKKSGALELTLSTPLTVREILEGQFLGLLRQFGPATGIILLLDILMMVVGAQRGSGSGDSSWVIMCFAGILVLVLDLFTLPTLGMWLALTSKRASRAALLTGFYILLLPWLILLGFVTFVMLARFSGIESFEFFIGAYFVISLMVDLLFFLWASGNLTSRFREVVTGRFDGRH